MNRSNGGVLLLILLIAAVVVVADQASKAFIVQEMNHGDSICVIGDYFRITHALNPGGAFGLFRDSGRAFKVLSFVAVILLVVAACVVPARGWNGRVAYGMVLGGAIGNLTDRLSMGRVVDFLDVGVGDLRWPIFNVADIAIVVGVGLFLLVSLRSGDSIVDSSHPAGGTEDDSGI